MISIVAAAIAVAAVAVAVVYYVYAQPAIHLLIERRALRLRSSRIVKPKSAGNVPEKIIVESSGKRAFSPLHSLFHELLQRSLVELL